MNCDRLAPWYLLLERIGFGRALERRREAFLEPMATARSVLVLGDGDGRFLAELLRVNRVAEVDSVDSSAGMIALARRRVQAGDTGRVRFHCADARTWQPPAAGYDLIVTHFFLDCFNDAELGPAVARLASFASPDVRWIVSEFRQPTGGPAAWYARAWITGLYTFFSLATGLGVRHLPDYAAALVAAGFRLEREIIVHFGLLTSQSWTRELEGFNV